MRLFVLITAAAVALGVSGCSGKDSHQAWVDSVFLMMNDQLQPAAEGIWDNAGYDITIEGERSLWPTTDEGWADVAASADEIIALTRELQEDKYSRGEEEWKAIADGLIVAAERVRDAANAQDEEEVFDAGGHLYRVCLACHQRYAIEEYE